MKIRKEIAFAYFTENDNLSKLMKFILNRGWKMERKLQDVKNIQIAYIGGGSRAWAHNLMNDLAEDKEIGGVVRLYDIDMEGAKINERIGNNLSAREDIKGKWTYKAYEKIGDALSGTPQELPMLITIRFIAFALAVIDCVIWLVPKEFPYATKAKTKLSNIFKLFC